MRFDGRTWLLATCAALAGCGTGSRAVGQDRQVAAAPLTAAPARCLTLPGMVHMNTCTKRPSGNYVCHVLVWGDASATFVAPHDLIAGTGRNPATIVWHLLDPGARFRDAGDGPALQADADFEDGGPTDDPDDGSNSASTPSRHFKWHDKMLQRGFSHKYTIQFLDSSGSVARCDPTITNQND